MSNPNQAILLVGGGLGIGLCVTRTILNMSAKTTKIVVFGLHADPELGSLSEKYPGQVCSIIGDVTSAADRIKAIETCRSHMAGVDTLVYSAGTMGAISRIEKLDIEAFKTVYDVNLFGLLAMVRIF